MPRMFEDLNKSDGELLLWALIETKQYPKPSGDETIEIDDILTSNKDNWMHEIGFVVRIRDIQNDRLIRSDYLEINADMSVFPNEYTLTICIGERFVNGVKCASETRFASLQLLVDWLFHVELLERLKFPTRLE